jgi:hypothetical protein
MVPMADLINHSLTNDNVSKYTFDDKTQTFIVHVQQPYAEGEQVRPGRASGPLPHTLACSHS